MRPILIAIVATFVTSAVANATEKGWFGFTANIAADSMFSLNPTIRAIKIDSVERDSPAARAGVVAGDEVLELENVKVAGPEGERAKAAHAEISRRNPSSPAQARRRQRVFRCARSRR